MATSENTNEGSTARNSHQAPEHAIPVGYQLTEKATCWMRLADAYETTGTPFVLAVFFTIFFMPVCQLRAVQDWYKSVFVGEILSWGLFTTFCFVLFLSLFLVIARMTAVSFRRLKSYGRAFRRLEKEKLINSTQSCRAMQFATIVWSLRRIGSSSQEVKKIQTLLDDPNIRKYL